MRLTMLLAALAVWMTGAGAAEAQAKRYGDWTLVCGEGQGCALRQRVVKKEDQSLLADITLNLRQVQGAPRVLLVAATPEAMALNVNPAYVVDSQSATVSLTWRTCADKVCRAAAILTPQQQGALMRGLVMRFGYRRFGAKEATSFPVSLRGVTAGLAALSTK